MAFCLKVNEKADKPKAKCFPLGSPNFSKACGVGSVVPCFASNPIVPLIPPVPIKRFRQP